MADNISFKWDESTEVTTGKNGYTEAQQRDYMVRTSTDLVKENRKVQEEELYSDTNFVDSMRILHAKQEGADAETPPDQELVKWGLGYLADVNYNLMDLGEAAVDFNSATDLEKMAMSYGLDTYDAKDVTWDGVGRFAEAFATDPTNLIGFGTLGAGFAAKFTGKTVAKQAFKKMLMNPANIAAVEGAVFTGAEDAMRQDLEVDVGMKDETSLAQTAMASTVGAVAGKALGEGAGYVGKKYGEFRQGQPTPPMRTGGLEIGTGKQVTVYHGTDKEFDTFNLDEAGATQGLDKGAVFFTTDKGRASTFDARYPQKSTYKYTDADKQSVKDAEASVKEVILEDKDILTISEVNKLYESGIIKTKPSINNLFRAESGHDMNREAIREAIKATGKKAFKFTAEGETQYAVYDTSIIKYNNLKKPQQLDTQMVQDYIGSHGQKNTEASGKLDIALKNTQGDYEGPAIRGMRDTEGTLSNLEVGDSYATRGVTSIGKDKATADTFANRDWDGETEGKKVYVTFDSFINKPVNLGKGNQLGFADVVDPQGASVDAPHFLEDEVVIPSGRNFEVVSKTVKDGEIHLNVKEVEN